MLDLRQCRPPSAALFERLGPIWERIGPYVDACPLRGRDGGTVLTVITLRLDRTPNVFIEESTRAGQAFPSDALILDAGLTPVGSVAMVPNEPPCFGRLGLSSWRDGAPRRIHYVSDGCFFDLATYPMVVWDWDPRLSRFGEMVVPENQRLQVIRNRDRNN